MAISTEENILINNVIYLDGIKLGDQTFKMGDETVGEFIDRIDNWMSIESNYNSVKDSNITTYTTGEEWKKIIKAAKADEKLMNMKIKTTHYAPEGGLSAVFINEETKDAVVAYRGTEGEKEWIDNFDSAVKADTYYQEEALKWYKDVYDKYDLGKYEVDLTGHSKGFNKAKYITIVDGRVDNCEGMDGEGFSDDFCDKYAEEIRVRQYLIKNHNAENDPVNPLLNDVGSIEYYKYQGENKNGLFENHCPNSILQIDENGNVSIERVENRPELIDEFDKFVNSMFRSAPEEYKEEVIELVKDIYINVIDPRIDNMKEGENFFDEETVAKLKEQLMDDNNRDVLAYVLGFTDKYLEKNPETDRLIRKELMSSNPDAYEKFSTIMDIIHDQYSSNSSNDIDLEIELLLEEAGNDPDKIDKEKLKEILSKYAKKVTGGHIPYWLIKKITPLLNKDGKNDYLSWLIDIGLIDIDIPLNDKELEIVFSVIDKSKEIKSHIDVKDGKDRQYGASSRAKGVFEKRAFSCKAQEMFSCSEELMSISNSLKAQFEEAEKKILKVSIPQKNLVAIGKKALKTRESAFNTVNNIDITSDNLAVITRNIIKTESLVGFYT